MMGDSQLIKKIIQGYATGHFLMDEAGILGWYTAPQRTLIPLDDRFHYPRSLQRVLNRHQFHTAINQDFAGVVYGCANREVTWISSELIEIYFALHDAGWAHSFEAWQGDELAGGILGIAIGGIFIGESMFYRITDGSKVALVKLVEHLRQQGFMLFDAQLNNPHLARFGSYTIKNDQYQRLLTQALRSSCRFIPDP
ncbi:leucyl/phenylalanyl-tRNA--protein transferase [Pseudocalidococcus azoricus]